MNTVYTGYTPVLSDWSTTYNLMPTISYDVAVLSGASSSVVNSVSITGFATDHNSSDNSSGATLTLAPYCGNNVTESGEQCDGE